MPTLTKNAMTPALVQTSKGKVNRADRSKPTQIPTSTLLMTATIPAVVRKTCRQDLCTPQIEWHALIIMC